MHGDVVPRSRALLIGYWLLFTIAATLSLLAQIVIPAFDGIFRSFGSDLPALTRNVVDFRLLLLALPGLAFFPALFFSLERIPQRQTHRAFMAGFATLLTIIFSVCVVVVIAMYLPIWTIEQAL